MPKPAWLFVLAISAVACSGSATSPSDSTNTGTLPPANGVSTANQTSYPITLSAAGTITVTVSSVTPPLAPDIPLRFYIGVPNTASTIGVPNSTAACKDDAAVDLWLVGAGSHCIGSLQCTTSTLPASVKRGVAAGSFCVGVENIENTTETYTLVITTG